MNRKIQTVVVALAVTFLGCSSEANSQELSRAKAKALIEAKPVELQTEDFIGLTDQQISCATSAGLLKVTRDNYGAVTTQTTDQGEKLGLHGYLWEGGPWYAETDDKELAGKKQIHLNGSLKLAVSVDAITGIDDEVGRAGTKLAAAEIRVKLPSACFPKPMKVGRSAHGTHPPLHFRFRRNDEGWYVEYQFQ